MEEKIKKILPNAFFGENSGLPFVAFPAKSTLSENLRAIEKILFILKDFGVQSYPILLDLKEGFVELRYAVTNDQQRILESAR